MVLFFAILMVDRQQIARQRAHRLDDEYAPSNTTEVVIHPTVKIIQAFVFEGCKKLRRVIMHQNVEIIENNAFQSCRSLDALFLPSSIKQIAQRAFYDCTNLRILSIPRQAIEIGKGKIGTDQIIFKCHTFFYVAGIQSYQVDAHSLKTNNDEVHQDIIDFYHNLSPLHQACLDTNVSVQSISECIETHGIATAYNTNYGLDRMTPMHILALNPHPDTGAILTLFHANMGAVFEPYSEVVDDKDDDEIPTCVTSGKTPLDAHLSVVGALCMHIREQ
mmetsp:Transcript_8123/g.9453  ORF Transcript_8123/g.9453 Transcript_8123/m.9453 type:complete len:276 (+) Transcript_8123:477-1304(+)